MGTYATVLLGKYELGSSIKNEIDTLILQLFRSSDKKIFLNSKDLPDDLSSYDEILEELENGVIAYIANASDLKDRLDILGFDFNTCKLVFHEWYKEEVKWMRHLYEESFKKQSFANEYLAEIELLDTITYEKWVSAVKTILNENLRSYKLKEFDEFDDLYKGTLIKILLKDEWFNFPGGNSFVVLRLILEDSSLGNNLIYDLTQLVDAGYYDADKDFVEYSIELETQSIDFAKTIILTEGKFDAWVLKNSLYLLYPHLSDYYTFMEFENSKFSGGVGSLVNIVKAFIGSGILNNTIAIFDNDTASESALRSLSNLTIPKNISILKLPELDLLKEYPTVGPTGNVLANVSCKY